MKKSLWLWRKNPENLTDQEQARMDQLDLKHLATGQAYRVRLKLQSLYRSRTVEKARQRWEDWIGWVHRKADRLGALLTPMRRLTDEAGLLDTFALRVQLVCRQLQLVTRTVAQYDAQIAALFPTHPDYAIFESLPGAGPVLGPRLLTAMGAQRDRYATAAALQRFTGIAPVTKQSGGKRVVHRRYRCPIFQRQSFHEYANQSILGCRWAAAYYLQQREGGAPHHTASAGVGAQMATDHLPLLENAHALQ